MLEVQPLSFNLAFIKSLAEKTENLNPVIMTMTVFIFVLITIFLIRSKKQ